MYRLYTLVVYLLTPWVAVRLFLRGLRNPAYWRRVPERFGFVQKLDDAEVVWIHAVSVGEVRAAEPLLRALTQRYPRNRFLVTTMTPTGSATVNQLFGDRVAHCYVPYDYPSAVRRFLDRMHPKIAVIMETELWPNLFRICDSRAIPVVVANVRMSESSMRKYLRFPAFTRSVLSFVDTYAVQNRADAERLRRLGANPESVHVTGSIKFELKLPAGLRESAQTMRRALGSGRPVWLAASTHAGEEEYVLTAARALKARFSDLLLVLVPRHPERFSAVTRLCRGSGLNTALRSGLRDTLDEHCEVLVGDTMGELQVFYAAADVAFVGGSLVATGGHNLLEAAAVGTPCVFGPHMFNFAEIGAMTIECGAGVQIDSADYLAAAIADFLENPQRRSTVGDAGKKMVEENRGALDRNLQLLGHILES